MFKPLFDNVLILEIEADRKLGSVLMPDIAREDMKYGQVAGTGKDCYQVAVRDIVCFGPHAGMRVQVAGVEFLLMREAEIKGVISDDGREGETGNNHPAPVESQVES